MLNTIINQKIAEVWQKEIIGKNPLATSQKNPQAFVLGGQPGVGKSQLIHLARKKLDKNIIVINSDNFRKYHPQYAEFQEQYKKESSEYTQEFAGKMTEAMLNQAVIERYNIVIEGTFRTFEIPIKTLQLLKDNGYKTGVLIQICDKKISWDSCLERYETMCKVNPKEARYTPKEHHDNVVANLANNIKKVQTSGLTDTLEIYARIPNKNSELEFQQLKIYDSKEELKINVATINRYLGISRGQKSNVGYVL